ncbi:hypothetical protein BN11_860002 [Nostocoides australiense Ben110]|uniref:Uncharacterized protein n=1 Tax=Nostocoides australiense Ben110 TaxID=1193182 RepID=W6K270_9MICO|nr:hypothetical protein BN11_860002 [Tetrasphaera australiensis Ben110]
MYSLVPVPEQLDGLTFCGLLLRCGENVADIGVGAVVGIEAVAAFDETVEFCLEQGEVPDACTHVGELAVDQYRHMRAGDVAVVAEIDDGAYLGEREACCLGGLNEAQPGEGGLVVGSVAVGTSFGCGQQAPAFVEPDGLAR